MNHNDIVTFIDEWDFENPSEIILADGFEEAFIGIGGQFHDEPVAIYDKNKCIDKLVNDFKSYADAFDKRNDTDFYTQAVEYFDYNVQGSYVGKRTPIFIVSFF